MQPGFDFPQPLSKKYQPHELAAFIGLAKPQAVMANFLRKPFPSAWLFLGPSGTGKTSMGLTLASTLPADLKLIPSRKCDLDAVEKACAECYYMPGSGFLSGVKGARFHMILAEEADQMSGAAQLAFLSKLDATDRPPATIFIFTANATAGLTDRFLSRLNTLEFSNGGTDAELPAFLRAVWQKETGRKRGGPDFEAMARDSIGNVRDALGRLEVALLSDGVETEPSLPAKPPTPLTRYQEAAHKAVATRTENIRRQIEEDKGGMKHTPGPWQIDDGDSMALGIFDDHGEAICYLSESPKDGIGLRAQDSANAALIVAAPELLAACKWVMEALDKGTLIRDISKDGDAGYFMASMHFVQELAKIQAAIAKAEGQCS